MTNLDGFKALLGEMKIGGGYKSKARSGGSDEFKASVKLLGGSDKASYSYKSGGSDKARGKAGGAKKMSESAYRKYLDNLTAERLQKIAKSKGIKITKKKDGKTVYVKKATLVKKLCDAKHGK